MNDRRGETIDQYSKAMAWIGGDQSKARIHICGCVGPQNGEPVCPCRMRNLIISNGRYVEVIDHGPVPSTDAA